MSSTFYRKVDEVMATTVFRVEKNREFVVMNNRFLRNKEMSLKAKGLLALCLSLPEDWDYSMNGLVAICKENITAIRSALKELEEHGHMRILKKKNEKGHFSYEYIIYETPDIENLYMDNQPMENLYVENHTQQSIKELSIKEPSIDNSLYISEHLQIIENNVDSYELKQMYVDYIEMRKSINAPLSPRGLKMLITRCVNLSHKDIRVQKLLLQNAIINQWKNVYRPSDQEVDAALNAEINDRKSTYGL